MTETIAGLESQIKREQTLLVQYEDMERLETDPRRRLKLQENIEEIKQHILTLETHIAQIRAENAPAIALQSRESVFIANVPYGLETALYGRDLELKLLDDWFHHDHDHPMMAIIGLGGQGKSALTWLWQKRLQAGRLAPPLVVWWSFYEADGTMWALLAELLAYFGDDPARFSSPRQMVDRLRQHLQHTPTLIVLDGAERLLRAYSSLGAAYQGDDETPDAPAITLERRHLRQCVDPAAGAFLQWLAQPGQTQALTLLTSRLFPEELAGPGGLGLQGVRRHDLTGLNLEAAYELFRALGIKTTRAEVRAVCEPLGYHPLSLRLLARAVRYSPMMPNDLQAAAAYDPTADLLGKREHVLRRAYDNLPQRTQLTLSRLAAFRSSVAWRVLADVFGGGQAVQSDLQLLEERGLLLRTIRLQDNGLRDTSYDLHPIVRRYAYDRLVDRAAVHGQLVVYFEAVPQPQRVNTLDDLQPAIELYHHLIRAQRYDEARVLFRDRLHRPLYYQLGAYQTVSELLRGLFPDGEAALPRLTKEADQAWTLNSLANSYSQSGQPGRAVPLSERVNDIFENLTKNKKQLAIGLGNLAHQQHSIGHLEAAAVNLRRRIALCQEIEERFWEAAGHQEHGRLLAAIGDWEAAEDELTASQKYNQENNDYQGLSVDWAYRAQAALWQGQAAEGRHAAQEALRLAEEDARTRYPHERDFVEVYWLLGWAQAELGQFTAAQGHLDEALRRCRAINNVEQEPSILLALARLAFAKSRESDQAAEWPGGEAAALAQEALQIAERAGYVLNQADIHNFLAAAALAAGQRDAARGHAQRAQALATCDGPPYVYKPALDEAERLLKELGAA